MATFTEVDYDPFASRTNRAAVTGGSDGTALASNDWSRINTSYAAGQPARDAERLRILQEERKSETDPQNIAALNREIGRVQRTTGAAGQGAQAAPRGPTFTEVDYDPFASKQEAQSSKPTEPVSDNPVAALGAGLGAGVGKAALGAQWLVGKGLGAIGATGAGDWLVKDAEAGRSKLSGELAPYKEASPVSANLGEFGGELVATLPVGGALAAPIKALGMTPRLAEAVATSGFRTGAPAATTFGGKITELGIRSAGGAAAGGAATALLEPDQAATGALIGAAMPPGIAGVGKALGYASNATKSIIQPFTESGQQAIAAKVINKFGAGGPMTINTAEIVPGSLPTLAEATGNAGIATLQRGARDLRPNAFVEREQANAAARSAAFDEAAGDAGKLEFFKASRATAADELYNKALAADPAANMTPYLKGQITQLLKRPSIDAASRTAQKWAIERGEKPSPSGSLTALHDVKTAVDDMIAEAVRRGAGGEAKALQGTKDRLLGVMEKLSPDYAEARHTYAEMSRPVNAMEALQGLKLTDAQGNITLAKVQGALRNLEQRRQAPGIDPAKAITDEQLGALYAVRDDLLRQSNLGLGRSIGSNTFQNLATDNIIGTVLPGPLGAFAQGKIGGALGQVGRIAYSGPNEAIRSRIVDLMLQPEMARQALNPPLRVSPITRIASTAGNATGPMAFAAAPLLGTRRED